MVAAAPDKVSSQVWPGTVTDVEASAPQVTVPFASVSRTEAPRQDGSRKSWSAPFERTMPFPKVDVAEVDLTAKVFASIPPEKVEVELPPETVRNPCKVEVPAVFPWMVEKVVVPIERS